MNHLTDTHCHLNLNQFNHDLDQVIQRARECGISQILIPGIDLETSLLAIELCEQYSELYAAVGFHPNNALRYKKSDINELQELTLHPKVVAIGEIGLDYYRDIAPKTIQSEVLTDMLALASEVKKPVIIHNRHAWHDLWPVLSAWQSKLVQTNNPLAEHPGVLHSYDGDLEMAHKAIQQKFLLGISGPATFTNASDHQTLVAALPLQVMLLETDSPFLTPHPHRGKRNEPAYVKFIAEKIAQLHHQSYEDVLLETSRNAEYLFSWRSID